MSFVSSRNQSARSPGGATPVLAVGQRVFVHCGTDRPGSVLLADENGVPSRSSLADGVEVEVVAWRPRGAGGTRYRVRAGADGTDGWLHASNLRISRVPPPVSDAPPVSRPDPRATSTGRRFGDRTWSR